MTSTIEIKSFWANKGTRRWIEFCLLGILCLLLLLPTEALASETEEPLIITHDYDTLHTGDSPKNEEPGFSPDSDAEDGGLIVEQTDKELQEDPWVPDTWSDDPNDYTPNIDTEVDPFGDVKVIDSFTGDELIPGEQTYSSLVKLSDSAYYDKKEKKYCYRLSVEGAEVTSNIMDGMITRDEVSLFLPEHMIFELYQDGELYEGDLTSISKKGSYTLNHIRDGGSEYVLSFRIIGKVVGDLYLYPMPAGFRMVELYKDGEQIATKRDEADLSQEGSYAINYRSPLTEVSYELRTMVDHTPPSFKVTGVKDGTARGPVQLSEFEEGISLYVYLEGYPLSLKSDNGVIELTQSGKYTVLVIDEAGNETREQFTVLIYLTAGSILFFVILVAGIVAGIVYAVMARKRLRIR